MGDYDELVKKHYVPWLEETYPGKAGQNRRKSFLKYLPMCFSLAGEDWDAIGTPATMEKIRVYDSENNCAGWHKCTLNCFMAFMDEHSGKVEKGTQAKKIAGRDESRRKGKEKRDEEKEKEKEKEEKPKAKEKPQKKEKKSETPAPALKTSKTSAGSKRKREDVVEGSEADKKEVASLSASGKRWGLLHTPHPPSSSTDLLFYSAPEEENCKLYYKNKCFSHPVWKEFIF
eukprot:TRINITY_DN9070_c0_g1_i1.p1 TRINITY_DN9070_c0_g1~~TRINITY_DN9070_c0_g1_i1.p1  ORF type:complete len:240 (+),score=78.19 TRINITY_DN9070_c0_g1_i1:31-720(+)